MSDPRFYAGQGDYILQLNLMDTAFQAALAAAGSIPEATALAEEARNQAVEAAGDAVFAAGQASGHAGTALQHKNDALTYRDSAQGARDLAIKWATFLGGEVVVGQGYSALKYANDAKVQADRAQEYADTVVQGQQQADWNQTTTTAPSFIKNKPAIPAPLGYTPSRGSSYNVTASSNLNAAAVSGNISFDGSDLVNAPTTGWYNYMTSQHRGGNTVNFAFAFKHSTGAMVDTYVGTANGVSSSEGTRTWTWNKLWHSGNDGTGSGLDADKLDGMEPAALPISTATQAALDLKADVTYVNSQVAGLVNSSPAALDTLKELGDALGGDANFATTTATALGNRLRIDISTQGLTAQQKTNAKTNLGLDLVDNTSDASKPVSTAQAAQLALKAPLASPLFTGDPKVDDHFLKTKFNDNTTSAAFNLKLGRMQRWAPTAGSSPTISVTNWPASGVLGVLLIEGVNLGQVTVFFPAGTTFIKADRTQVGAFSQMGVTFQSNGTDRFYLFSRDGGATIYMKMM